MAYGWELRWITLSLSYPLPVLWHSHWVHIKEENGGIFGPGQTSFIEIFAGLYEPLAFHRQKSVTSDSVAKMAKMGWSRSRNCPPREDVMAEEWIGPKIALLLFCIFVLYLVYIHSRAWENTRCKFSDSDAATIREENAVRTQHMPIYLSRCIIFHVFFLAQKW